MLHEILFHRNGVLPKKEKWNKSMVVCNGTIESECHLVAEDTKQNSYKLDCNSLVNNIMKQTN